jgi:RHS repeat-associated protein
MRSQRLLALVILALGLPAAAGAADKNGVAPRAISLPSGPGSIQGLGESFQPQLNTGSGSYRVPLAFPKGSGGLAPELALVYNSGAGNGTLGLGWSLAGLPSIRRNTDRGVPYYVDGPNGADDDFDGRIDNPEELDAFTGANQEELVPLADGSFRAENEEAFWRHLRLGAGWEAHSPDGRRLLFGSSAQAQVEDGGKVFAWCLERQTDRSGNAIDYEYAADPATPAQKHLRRIRWGQESAFFAAVLRYEEGRPDASTSYQSGFALRTSVRLIGIDVFSQGIPAPAFAQRGDFDGDGRSDALIRRYRLEYDAASHLSLLARVTQLGADGSTALPALSFGYSEWTPPDNVAATLIRSRNAPPEGFDSGSVELIDTNGDGLPDLLSTAASQHRVSLNRGLDADGRLAWAPSRPVDQAPTVDIASDRTHLADATADGLSDLMVKVTNTTFFCYDNTGRNSWTAAPIPIRSTDTWPIWPYDGEGGRLSRSIDTDYSRSNDVFHTSDAGNQLWLLLPDGRFSKELRLPPLVCEGKVFRFDLPGTQIADLNGDRLQDLAWIQPSRVVYFPNRGRGDFAEPIFLDLGRTLSAAEIARGDFSDVDGDGLVDLTLVRPSFEPNGVVYWLNRFDRGLEAARTVRGLPALSAGDSLRWADMNGNGTTDIVISQAQSAPGEKILVVDLVPEGKIHLLERIENGLGLRVDLEYESSTAQMVRAEAAGAPWSSVMQLAVTVVSRIVENDGRGGVYDRSIAYRDPHYDARKQEFRGFESAEAREAGDASAEGKRERVVFDTGIESACLKGKPLSESLLGDDGALFHRSVHTWDTRVLGVGIDRREVCFAFQAASDRFVHEGEPEGVRLRKETDYDDYGNAVAERDHGVLSEAGDESFVERSFEPRLDVWLLNLTKTETRRDGAGRRLADQRFFYDASGRLERSESWLDTEDRWVAVLRQRFDAFGNVVETIDARGHRRSVAYDPLLYALPVRETLHLGSRDLEMRAEHDLGLGLVSSATDFHGRRYDYVYDPLGRLLEQRMPGGAGELYEYQPSSPVSRVIKRLRLDAEGSTFDSYAYSDCYGRPLGTKIEAEDGRWRALEFKSYNSRKLLERSWLPFASETPDFEPADAALPHDAHVYDAEGRTVRTVRADGSTTRQEHHPLLMAVYDGNDAASGGLPDLRRSDGLGRMVSVEEQNGGESYLTRYLWNARGELEAVIDALGNVKRFRFDSLGRMVESHDPNRGLRRYAFDDAGNLIRRQDAKGQITTFAYDAANRIVERDYEGRLQGGADPKDAIYHYDAPAGELDFGDGTRGSARNVAGRLAWVEDPSGEEHFSYDERGNVEWVLKRLRDAETGIVFPYRIQRVHDLLNRETEIVFPDNDRVRYLRNDGGFVERIDGGPLGAVILASAEYAPNGQPLRLSLGNGVESLFAYDGGQRLATLRALEPLGQELLHEDIVYDASSNVAEIVDRRALDEVPAASPRRRTARFGYDELGRLVSASYGDAASLGRIDYAYDALGNLLRQSTPPPGAIGHIGDASVSLGALDYGGGRSGRAGRQPADAPGPHAVTATESGLRFGYDASGNVATYGAASLSRDFEDRIERFVQAGLRADYVHDHAGRRVLKRVVRGGARDVTHYADAAFEVENGSPAKYAFLNGRRLARFSGRLDPSRDAAQKLVLSAGWNLVTAAVESAARMRDAFGADAAVYEARASSYAPLDTAAALPLGRAIWVHAPTARLAVLRGRYAAAAAEIASPGPLHAWPRLEPFVPEHHFDGPARLMVYDAASLRWLRRDPTLPAFLNDAPSTLGAARAFWSPGPATLRPRAAPAAALFYHLDHLGSPAATTDGEGKLVEERAHYPYGALRSRYRPPGAAGAEPGSGRWDFTGKERDGESGLVDMGVRAYLDLAGVFLSPDPRFADAAALAEGGPADEASFAAYLANPQMGNLYAHGTRNPLKYVDPSGLEVVLSKVLRDSPVFQEAYDLFKSTKEGQRLLGRIEKSGAKVTMRAGRVFGTDPRTGKHGELLGQAHLNTRKVDAGVSINLLHHKAIRADRDALILELADTIHHELRHVEGNINLKEFRQMRGILRAVGDAAASMGLDRHPVSPTLRMGDEVHRGLDVNQDDPYNQTFKQEASRAQLLKRTGGLIEFDL